MNIVKCVCKRELSLEVCENVAGYYLGYYCSICGPYNRVSHYFATQEEAEEALKTSNRKTKKEKSMNRKMMIIGVILEAILIIALITSISTNIMVLNAIEKDCTCEEGE